MQLENSTDFVKTEPSEILKKRPKQRERETTSAGEKDEIDEDRQILPQSKRQKRERASSKTKADQIVSDKAEFIVFRLSSFSSQKFTKLVFPIYRCLLKIR